MTDRKISDLTTQTGAVLASGDLFETVDISDTTMGATGTNKKITATELATGLADVQYNAAYVAFLGPSGDTTGVADSAAIVSALGTSPHVLLGAGAWYVKDATLTQSSRWLQGRGPGTILNVVSGHSGLILSGVSKFVLSDLLISGGTTGIDVEGAADSRFFNLYLDGQSTSAVHINGDDSTEQHWSDVVITNAAGIGFDYARTTNADMGGLYLSRVRIIQGGSGATYAYRFQCTGASAPNINLFMAECVGDNWPGSAALLIDKCKAGLITGSWFTSRTTAPSGAGCVHFANGASGYSLTGCHTVQPSTTGTAFGVLIDGSAAQVILDGHTFAGSSNTALGVSGAGTDICIGNYYSSQPTFVDTPANLSNVTILSGPRTFLTRGSGGSGNALAIEDSDSPASAKKYVRNAGGAFQILNGAFSSAIFALADNGKITTPLQTTNSTLDDGSGNLSTGGSVSAGGAGITLNNDGHIAFQNNGGRAFYNGSGAPSSGLGSNGDFYFRTDTPGTPNQRLYVKSAGAWTGIL